MPANTTEIEKRLWEAADDLRANSKLKSSEYSIPVLGLIFLRYTDYKFEQAVETLRATSPQSLRRPIGKADYQARGVAIFDILTRPSPRLTKAEREQVKRLAQQLLDTLKAERLVLEWRSRQQTRAAVFVAIQEVLENLPQKYSDEEYNVKCEAVYQHVYDSYYGAGGSVYHVAG